MGELMKAERPTQISTGPVPFFGKGGGWVLNIPWEHSDSFRPPLHLGLECCPLRSGPLLMPEAGGNF